MEKDLDDISVSEKENLLNDSALNFMVRAGSWSKFLAILMFIGAGFAFLGGLMFMAIGSSFGEAFGMLPFSPALFGFVYMALGLVYLMPAMYLLRFANKARDAQTNRSPQDVEGSIKNLFFYFRFIGILIIAMIALYIVAFIAMAAMAPSMY